MTKNEKSPYDQLNEFEEQLHTKRLIADAAVGRMKSVFETLAPRQAKAFSKKFDVFRHFVTDVIESQEEYLEVAKSHKVSADLVSQLEKDVFLVEVWHDAIYTTDGAKLREEGYHYEVVDASIVSLREGYAAFGDEHDPASGTLTLIRAIPTEYTREIVRAPLSIALEMQSATDPNFKAREDTERVLENLDLSALQVGEIVE